MVPAFHAAVFRSENANRVILNVGGIANITILPKDSNAPVTGLDTGPGNTLMDQWIRLHLNQAFDKNGEWAAHGHVNDALLKNLLADPYLARTPPKSTGREHFHLAWLERHLATINCASEDIQATLLEFTCQSIALDIQKYAPGTAEVFVCGGGAHNTQILKRLEQLLPQAAVQTTSVLGLDPDWVEAAAFAWLARQTMHQQAGNMISVTGAKHPVILGGIYQAQK